MHVCYQEKKYFLVQKNSKKILHFPSYRDVKSNRFFYRKMENNYEKNVCYLNESFFCAD